MPSKVRKRSLGALCAQLQDIPPNVATLKFDPVSGAFEATFRDLAPPPAPASADVEEQDEDEGDPRFLLERLAQANFGGKA